MNYWLHPEARQDLREAARFYQERSGASLAHLLLAEFDRFTFWLHPWTPQSIEQLAPIVEAAHKL